MVTGIKLTRITFHLSEQYVAKYLNIPWLDYVLIEEGIAPITEPQIQKLNILYGTNTDELLYAKEQTDEDKINDLIKFKRRINHE